MESCLVLTGIVEQEYLINLIKICDSSLSIPKMTSVGFDLLAQVHS